MCFPDLLYHLIRQQHHQVKDRRGDVTAESTSDLALQQNHGYDKILCATKLFLRFLLRRGLWVLRLTDLTF